MYIRYRQIEYVIIRHEYSCNNHLINKRSFFVGIVAAIGVSIVGNVQESACLFMHWVGASMCFGLGALYQCLQVCF